MKHQMVVFKGKAKSRYKDPEEEQTGKKGSFKLELFYLPLYSKASVNSEYNASSIILQMNS